MVFLLLQMAFEKTAMARGVVGILVSILLSEGRREKGAKLPQTVISLCVQVRVGQRWEDLLGKMEEIF